MTPQEYEEILERTLDDGRVTRSEKKALSAVLEDQQPTANTLADLRHRAFEVLATKMHDPRDRALLDWLEDIVKILAVRPVGPPSAAEALFSPGEHCRERIVGLLKSARRTADICVFTITDNVISREILAAHERNVQIRVLTDDDKALDRGSDIYEVARAGIPVVKDTSDKHMHHKFAVFDQEKVLTGSYNWTRSAALANEENIVVSEDTRLVRAFAEEFERLWQLYSD